MPNDKYIGRYVQVPFKAGWFFGIIKEKIVDPDDPTKKVYKIVYEDKEEWEMDQDRLDHFMAEPDIARRKKRPLMRDIKKAHHQPAPAKVKVNKKDTKKTVTFAHKERTEKEEPTVRAKPRSIRRPSTRPKVDYTSQLYARAFVFANDPAHEHGPLSQFEIDSYNIRELREVEDGQIRPHRLEAVGVKADITDADKEFIDKAIRDDIPVTYLMDNPKVKKTESHKRYANYSVANTLKQTIDLSVADKGEGVTKEQAKTLAHQDILWDYQHGYIFFPGNESLLDGHYVNAKSLAADHKMLCRSEQIMGLSTEDVDRILTLNANVTLQNMLIDEKRKQDALKFI